MFLSSTPINISGCLDILTCGVFVFTSVSKQADDDCCVSVILKLSWAIILKSPKPVGKLLD